MQHAQCTAPLSSQTQRLLIPVLIGVIVSCGISGFLSKSIYDQILILKGLPYMPHLRTELMFQLKAENIMRPTQAALARARLMAMKKNGSGTNNSVSGSSHDSPCSHDTEASICQDWQGDKTEEGDTYSSALDYVLPTSNPYHPSQQESDTLEDQALPVIRYDMTFREVLAVCRVRGDHFYPLVKSADNPALLGTVMRAQLVEWFLEEYALQQEWKEALGSEMGEEEVLDGVDDVIEEGEENSSNKGSPIIAHVALPPLDMSSGIASKKTRAGILTPRHLWDEGTTVLEFSQAEAGIRAAAEQPLDAELNVPSVQSCSCAEGQRTTPKPTASQHSQMIEGTCRTEPTDSSQSHEVVLADDSTDELFKQPAVDAGVEVRAVEQILPSQNVSMQSAEMWWRQHILEPIANADGTSIDTILQRASTPRKTDSSHVSVPPSPPEISTPTSPQLPPGPTNSLSCLSHDSKEHYDTLREDVTTFAHASRPRSSVSRSTTSEGRESWAVRDGTSHAGRDRSSTFGSNLSRTPSRNSGRLSRRDSAARIRPSMRESLALASPMLHEHLAKRLSHRHSTISSRRDNLGFVDPTLSFDVASGDEAGIESYAEQVMSVYLMMRFSLREVAILLVLVDRKITADINANDPFRTVRCRCLRLARPCRRFRAFKSQRKSLGGWKRF